MRKFRPIFILAIAIACLFVAQAIFQKPAIVPLEDYQSFLPETPEGKILYTGYLDTHKTLLAETIPQKLISMTDVTLSNPGSTVSETEDGGYEDSAVLLSSNESLAFSVTVETDALYQILIDYRYLGTELFSPKFGLRIDQEYPFYESLQTTLPLHFVPQTAFSQETFQKVYCFDTDRYGNDVQPKAETDSSWYSDWLYDASYGYQTPLLFYFEQGTHVVELEARNDQTMIGNIMLASVQEVPSYSEYFSDHGTFPYYEGVITLEAEYFAEKSDPSVKLYADQRSASTPFSLTDRKLNAADSYTWDEAGRSITWIFDVPSDGLYEISFKYIQYKLNNIASYREIKINNEILFKEMAAYPFFYTNDWKNETLGNEDGAFLFYLHEGENSITLKSVSDPYRPIMETMSTILENVTDLTLEVQRLTGGNSDADRDWALIEFIPDIEDRLNLWADELEKAFRYGHFVGKTTDASELVNLQIAYEQLRKLSSDPNDLPNQMNLLSEGSTSVSQYLGDLMLRISRQSLGLEKIYVLGEKSTVPSAQADFFTNLWVGIQSFFLSFRASDAPTTDPETTLEIWVNRPRANLDLMQKMIDETFTKDTGISVNITLMPNPTKLILANTAKIEPDIAMGVTNSTPYNFALRNAACDLRQFVGYEETVSQFAKGSMIPYIYEEGVYGFPDTQDFYVTFFRTDLLSEVNAPIPSTWEEVIGILPELRRMGMNYYIPMGGSNSYKSFTLTAPFYFQNKASLYSADGMSSAIDSEAGIEAMNLMSKLFTIYDLPKETSNFYNHFRYGDLPIGIGNSATYLQLLIAAPEIKGNWDIALHPGTPDGEEILRYAAAPTSGNMIFESSEKQEMAFSFLQWWHSTETQIAFSSDIQRMFGKEYMWFSSNLAALAALPIESEDLDVILEQLSWAAEAPQTPAGYSLEREISNAWNRIVFNDENIRTAVDTACLTANRELIRKMTEFGYIKDLQIVKEYLIPTVGNINDWLTEKRDPS